MIIFGFGMEKQKNSENSEPQELRKYNVRQIACNIHSGTLYWVNIVCLGFCLKLSKLFTVFFRKDSDIMSSTVTQTNILSSTVKYFNKYSE